ncbi:MAG TPA: Ig-like domain-containing protein, partial [Pyrinomonadaceae bacterium]|nr:Ig-like domain-containing protein [Pyrinomonadaceae bacterium]
MKSTHPRSEFRSSRTSSAILLALFTLVSPLSPLFAAGARAQGGAPRPVSDGRAAQPAEGGDQQQGGDGDAKAPKLAAPQAGTPTITATMDDGVALNQTKRPGDPVPLTYTVTIKNTGTGDANDVKFLNDLTNNANLTLVSNSVQTQPLARADSYDVLGNVRINVPAASGLLTNDSDPDGTAIRITAFDAASVRGGNVTVDTSTGAFTYNPPAGYDGTDEFTYTIKDAGPDGTAGNSDDATDTATVKLTVAGMIWFVNNNHAQSYTCTSRADGCGRLTTPFSDLLSFQAANTLVTPGTNNGDTVDPEAGDNIFLYTGNGDYTAPLTLKNTQKLIGQGATDTLATIALGAGNNPPAHSDPLPQTKAQNNILNPPTITSLTTGILLASDNTLRGFNVGAVGTAQAKIQGTSFGTLTVGKTSAPDINLSGAGRMLNLTTGSFAANSGFNSAASTGSSGDAALFLSGITPPAGGGTLTFVGVSTASAATEGVEVTGSTANIDFGDVTVTGGADGISLSNNTGGTRTFASITVQNNSGDAFRHTGGGGATTVTGATAITNPGNRGIVIQSSTTAVSFANASVMQSAGAGVLLGGASLGNSAAISFTDLDIAPDPTATAFFAQANTAAVTATSGTITASENAAVTAIGVSAMSLIPLSVTFDSVSCSMSNAVSQFCVNLQDTTGGLAMNGGSLTGGGGSTFNVLRGNATISYAGTVSQANGQRVVSVEGTTGGSVIFTNTVTATGNSTGVRIVNANGNVNFSALNLGTSGARLASNAVSISGGTGAYSLGAVSIFTNNAAGINATDADGAISTASGTVDATNGTAISIDGPSTLTTLGVTLNSISSTNAATNGVIVQDADGTFTMTPAGATEVTITNPTGTGLQVQNTSAAFSFADATVNGSGNGSGDDLGTGVLLSNNSGAITFGALNIAPDTGERGLLATDTNTSTLAGAITIGSGTITTTNDTAVEITGAGALTTPTNQRTPLNIQLTAVNTNGGDVAANGIRLQNTSAVNSPGGFRVLGTGGTCTNANTTGCTGGTINDTSGPDSATAPAGSGIHMQNVDSVSFTRMLVRDHPNYGIRGSNVNGFTLSTSVVRVNGTNGAGPFREGSVSFDGADFGGVGLTGSSAITNSDIRQGFFDNLRIFNNSGTMNLTVTGTTFRDNDAGVGNDNVSIEVNNSATGIVSITGSTFAAAKGDHFNVTLGNNAVSHITFTGNTLSGGHPTVLGGGIFIFAANWNGTARYNISNNQMTGTRQGHAIHTNKGSGTGAMQGTISGNQIGNAAVAESGASESSAITVAARGAGGSHVAVVSGNTVTQYDEFAINLEAGEDGGPNDPAANSSPSATSGPAASLDVTVTGNTAFTTVTTPNALHGIHMNFGILDGDNNNVCADIGGAGALANNVTNAAGDNTGGTPNNGGSDIRSRQRHATQVRLPGYGGSAFDTAAVAAYLAGRNLATTVTAQANDSVRANDGYVGGAACAQPQAPQTPTMPSTIIGGGEELTTQQAAAQQSSLPTTIPGLMITRQPQQQQAAGQVQTPVAPQPAAQPVAQPKAESAKSAASQTSRGGGEKSKKVVTGGKVGVAQPQAGMFEVTIGTLAAGDEVTITFQATISPALTPASASSLSNQGTVSGTNFSNVSTDDPETPTAGDATVTNIDKYEPTVTLSSGQNPSDQGQPVTFTATLGLGTAPGPAGPTQPAPTGTVIFRDQTDANQANWVTLCTETISGTTATCQTSALAGGDRKIVAHYGGDGRFDPATSNELTQTVQVCQSALTVTKTVDDGTAGTLRNAIANACSGAAISFDIAGDGPHTITLTSGELLIDKNLTITGPTNESVTVSGGNANLRAFHVSGGTVGISNLTVTGAKPTTGSGGGLLVEGSTTVVTVSGMTFTGNSANGGAGGAAGVAGSGAVLNIYNTTVSGNEANFGGGLYNSGATLNLVNVTVTKNDANNGDTNTPGAGQGGGISSESSTTNIRNSIITGNLGVAGKENILGTTVDQGNNLIGVDAGLDPVLASNGGPTQTHRLLANSPALDAGNNCVLIAGGCGANDPAVALTTDQRGPGFTRSADSLSDPDETATVDIGAFEVGVCQAPPADMVAWYTADGHANDIAGATSENGALQNGATFDTGKVGQAFKFDGADDIVTVSPPGALDITGSQLTIDGWIKPAANTTAFYFGRSASSDHPYVAYFVAGSGHDDVHIITKTSQDNTNLEYHTGYTPPVGDWTHLAFVYDGAAMKLYANGAQVFSGARTGNLLSSTLPFAIGNRVNDPIASFNGLIDEVEVFSRALSAGEIQAIYGANGGGKCRAPFAFDDSYQTDEDGGALTVNAPGVLSNDNDGNSQAITVADADPQTNGVQPVSGPSNAQSFTLNADGSFSYTPNANFAGQDTFTYKATDGASESNVATVTITVTAVNDPPAGADNTVNALEDTAYTFAVADFPFTDPLDSPANSLSAVTITTLPAAGALTNDGAPVSAGQSIPAANISGGKLKFTPAANANGTPYTSFTFQVQDNGGGTDLDPVANTLTINVTPVNDEPSFTKGPDQTVSEDAGAQTVPDWATNISAGPPDESGQALTFNVMVTGTTGTLSFSAGPAVGSDGKLTYTPAANTHGTATVSVTLSDNGGVANNGDDDTSPAQTFTITVSPVADGVSVEDATTRVSTQTALGDLTVTRDAADGAEVTHFKVTSITNGKVFLADGQTEVAEGGFVAFGAGGATELRFTPDANKSTPGGQTFSFTVRAAVCDTGDSCLGGATDTAAITVNKHDATVTITADTPDESFAGQPVTVTFTVTGATGSPGSPSGDVTISTNNGSETCTAAASVGQCQITLAAAGSHTLTATYAGDAVFNGATDTEPHTVVGASSVRINDGRARTSEGKIIFTLSLSAASGSQSISVSYATQPGTATEGAGPNCGAGDDYVAKSGTVTFAAGETFKTIEITLCPGEAEPDETFLVNLSNPNPPAVVIADGQATGTITDANEPGAILISEIRTSGPGAGGAGDLEDDFVELFNNSNEPVTVPSGGWGLFQQGAACTDAPVLIATVPETTVIPARGHYLIAGTGYSLDAVASRNGSFQEPLEVDRNVGLFSTTSLAGLSTAARLDAVGFGANAGGSCDLLREGAGLAPTQGSASEHSYYRKLNTGRPADTGANASDFLLVSTTPGILVGSAGASLGAPGPERSTSPIQRNDRVKSSLIDPQVSGQAAPNTERRSKQNCAPGAPPADPADECDPNRSQFGTFAIRRRWRNNTGANITQLRFRVVDVTAGTAPAGTADLRAITSVQTTVNLT